MNSSYSGNAQLAWSVRSCEIVWPVKNVEWYSRQVNETAHVCKGREPKIWWCTAKVVATTESWQTFLSRVGRHFGIHHVEATILARCSLGSRAYIKMWVDMSVRDMQNRKGLTRSWPGKGLVCWFGQKPLSVIDRAPGLGVAYAELIAV